MNFNKTIKLAFVRILKAKNADIGGLWEEEHSEIKTLVDACEACTAACSMHDEAGCKASAKTCRDHARKINEDFEKAGMAAFAQSGFACIFHSRRELGDQGRKNAFQISC